MVLNIDKKEIDDIESYFIILNNVLKDVVATSNVEMNESIIDDGLETLDVAEEYMQFKMKFRKELLLSKLEDKDIVKKNKVKI